MKPVPRPSALLAAGLLLLGLPACEQKPADPFQMQPLERTRPAPPKPAPHEPAQPEVEPPDAQPAPPAEEPVPEGAVRLRWQIAVDGALGYRAELERATGTETFGAIEALARRGELPAETARRLASLRPSGQAGLVAIMSANPGGTFTVRVTGRERDGGRSRDPNVAKLAETETVVLWEGALTASGQALAYSLPEIQRLTLGLLFELPHRPVRPEDTWSLEVELLPREPRLSVQDSARWNEVRLVSLSPLADGEQLAVLEYRLAEVQKGVLSEPDEPERPVTRLASYLGRAEFLVRQGRLRFHAGWLQTSIQGPEPLRETRLLSLSALDAVPRELIDLR
jgi:hypothetical protein